MIKYSEPIARFIWRDKQDDDEVIIQNDGTEIVTALVAIIGLYFMVSVLAKAISELVKFAISSPGYFDKTYLRDTIITGIAYELILFIFGMFLFTKSEKIINFRERLKRGPLIDKDEVN